jgi:hypothetical protein
MLFSRPVPLRRHFWIAFFTFGSLAFAGQRSIGFWTEIEPSRAGENSVCVKLLAARSAGGAGEFAVHIGKITFTDGSESILALGFQVRRGDPNREIEIILSAIRDAPETKTIGSANLPSGSVLDTSAAISVTFQTDLADIVASLGIRDDDVPFVTGFIQGKAQLLLNSELIKLWLLLQTTGGRLGTWG